MQKPASLRRRVKICDRPVNDPGLGSKGYAALGNPNWAGALRILPLPVVLYPSGAQPRKAVLVDGCLPIEEFIDAERVTLTCFF